MTTENDERWLKVLAGKAEADDADTRQAVGLRNYFEQQDQHTPALDEAAQRRIMNALAAKGAFAQAIPVQPVQRPGLLAQVLQWLFPQGRFSGGRFAGVAVAVLAVLVLPFVLHSPTGDDDPSGIKSLPTGLNNPTVVIDSAQPEQLAAQLVATLARHGVLAELRAEGVDRWVQAQIPAQRMASVQSELVSLGLAAQPDGRLIVQFRRQP